MNEVRTTSPTTAPPAAAGAGGVSKPGVALAAAIVVGLIWAGWVVVSALGLRDGLTPFDLTLLRFAIPAVLTFPWLLRGSVRRNWRRLLALGAFAGAPHALLIQYGLAHSTTAHAAIFLPGFIPPFAAALGWILFGERPGRAAFAGFVLIIAGAALITMDNAGGTGTGSLLHPGDILFVTGALVWAAFTIGLKAWRVGPMEAVAVVSVVSTVIYLPIYLLFLPSALLTTPVDAVLIQAVYQGVVGIVIAIALYTLVVQLAGPQRAATISASVPIFTLLLAIVVLGDMPAWLHVAGAIACGIGIWLVVAVGAPAAPKPPRD